MKIFAGILGGLLLAILATTLVAITGAASSTAEQTGGVVFFASWLVGLVVALLAPRAAKAWRRLLISSAVLSFMLPLSGLIYTGSFMANNTSSAAEAAGAAIGGGLVTGTLGFVGFFLGIVLLIVGLLVGRDPTIVYVTERPQSIKAS